MAFQLSPGVNFSEIDLTNATAAVATTEGALAGVFRWGPINERTLITSETQLVEVFGKPYSNYKGSGNTDFWTNHETFYTAANFLGYSDALYVTRVVETTSTVAGEFGAEAGDATAATDFKAKYFGELGNSLEVAFCKGTTAGVNSFNGLEFSQSRVAGVQGATTLNINGLGSGTEAQSFKEGDVLSIVDSNDNPLQELTIAADAVVGAGSSNSDQTINFGAIANAHDGADHDYGAGTEGVIVSVDTNDQTIAESGIIILESDVTIAKGDPVIFAGAVDGLPTELVSGVTYYAIPVNDNDDTFGGGSNAVGDLITATASKALKVAATYDDALAYDPTDTTTLSNAIELSAATDAANLASQVELFSQTSCEVTFTEKFLGLPGSYSYKKHWGSYETFDAAPSSQNNVHIVVKDSDGEISGTPGTILETFDDVSTVGGTRRPDGTSNFISDVLTATSKWIKLAEANADDLTGDTVSSLPFSAGQDGKDEAGISLGDLALGYDTFQDGGEVDVSFILQGKPRGDSATGHELSNYIIDNIAESRRDCVAFVSPHLSDDNSAKIVEFAGQLTASSYAVVDSGYKYQYDKYSDVYRWVPLNGDIAGLCARTDDLRDPWFSPAGYNRGNVKNVVKLKFNPNKAQRDLLYKNGVNPVITQAGQGTVLFGDKTYSGKTSAFDRINVRRLFIVLEKTIARAAKSTLFEFNDEFTRANFRNLVEPFLRDVQGRRGIYDFKVICDESNNTGQVIDTNSFVGDIYIKPARSINFIQLNFVAVRTGVEFSEVVGAA